MQVATVRGGKPWSCTVYYVTDDKLNLYWVSLPTRRHSREITDDSRCAISIPVVHEKGQKVIGIQAEGTAKIIENSSAIKPIAKKYAAVFGLDEKWAGKFAGLETQHRLYKFTPDKYVLFDEQNFPDSPRKEIDPRSQQG